MSEFHDLPCDERRRILRDYIKKPSPEVAASLLAPLRTANKRGLYASKLSEHTLFGGAHFGRDSIETAEDTLEVDPEIARQTILMHVQFQGVTDDPDYSESRIGKSFHEHRERRDPEGALYPDAVQAIITELRDVKGWAAPNTSNENLTYYGSVDATPLFVRLVKKYVGRHGEGILDEEVTGLDGKSKTVAEAVCAAADFMVDEYKRAQSGHTNPIGLYVWQRTNKGGLVSQAWKDSPYAYLALRPETKDGFEIANYEGGVASAEVQGYVYDALKSAALLLQDRDATRDQVASWRATARELRTHTVQKLLHGDDTSFIAQGMDYDAYGHPRLLATQTTNALTLFDSDLIPDALQDTYIQRPLKIQLATTVGNMVLTAMGPHFKVDAGLRERALQHTLVDFVDYHGSRVSWAKSTLDVANGFWRQRYKQQAIELYELIVNRAVVTAGNFYEFDRISNDADKAEADTYVRQEAAFDFQHGEAHLPELYQAWTVTAFLKAVSRLRAVAK